MSVISFEGSDLTGKTSTLSEISSRLETDIDVNRGPIYDNELISQCLELSEDTGKKGREFLYTVAYVADRIEHENRDTQDELVFQDRYWPSVIAYGRFLNEEDSLYHENNPSTDHFIEPDLVFHLTCSVEERMRRDRERRDSSRSSIDKEVLSSEEEMRRMDSEVEKSLSELNTYRIDTTERSIESVTSEIEDVLYHHELLDYNHLEA